MNQTGTVSNAPAVNRQGARVRYWDQANDLTGVIDGYDYQSGMWSVTWDKGGMSTVPERTIAGTENKPIEVAGWRLWNGEA